MGVTDGWQSGRRVAATLVLAVLLAVAGLGTGFVLVVAAAGLLGEAGVALSAAEQVAVSAGVLQGGAFGGVAAAYLRLRGLGWDYVGASVPDLREALWAASGYVLAILGALCVGAVAVLAGLDPAQNRIAEVGAENPEVFLLRVPVTLVLIGPGEELLFRGLVQGTLREVFGPAPAIVVASLVFAAAHVTSLSGAPGGRLVTVGLLFVPALVLGVAYEATGNVVVPSLIHGAYNATLFALAYASIRFQAAGLLLPA
jgi:membrane protease YdiL (CAAX protease family)